MLPLCSGPFGQTCRCYESQAVRRTTIRDRADTGSTAIRIGKSCSLNALNNCPMWAKVSFSVIRSSINCQGLQSNCHASAAMPSKALRPRWTDGRAATSQNQRCRFGTECQSRLELSDSAIVNALISAIENSSPAMNRECFTKASANSNALVAC
jgi:hypothetical protein